MNDHDYNADDYSTKLCVLCRTTIPLLQEHQCCDACRAAHPTTQEETETMAGRKKKAKKTRKAAPRKGRPANRGNGASARNPPPPPEDDPDPEPEARPRKPKTEIERASMFAVVETVTGDDEQELDRVLDLSFDEGSAELIKAAAEQDGHTAFVDPVDALLIKTKIPGTRGKFEVDAYVLDRAAEQPTKPETSEFAGAALVRKQALGKLTAAERVALGLPADIGDVPPPDPIHSRGSGSASNPNEPDDPDDDDDDQHDAGDNAPDPFG